MSAPATLNCPPHIEAEHHELRRLLGLPESARVGRHMYHILDVSQILLYSNTGSGDYLPAEERVRCVRWLKWRVENWQPSRGSHVQRVDDAIKAFAVAVLEMESECPKCGRSMPYDDDGELVGHTRSTDRGYQVTCENTEAAIDRRFRRWGFQGKR